MHKNVHRFSLAEPLITFLDTFLKNCLILRMKLSISRVSYRFYPGLTFIACTLAVSCHPSLVALSPIPPPPTFPLPPNVLTFLFLLLLFFFIFWLGILTQGGQIGGGWLRGPWASPIFGSLKVSAFFPNTQSRYGSGCSRQYHETHEPIWSTSYFHLTNWF